MKKNKYTDLKLQTEAKISKLISQCGGTALIAESVLAEDRHVYVRELVSEAVNHEKYTILEAFESMTGDEVEQQFEAMLDAADLVSRSLKLGSLRRASDEARQLGPAEQGLLMAGTITRLLMAVSHVFVADSESEGGKAAGMVRSLMTSREATTSSLMRALASFDAAALDVDHEEEGFFSRFKKAVGMKRSGTGNMTERFRNELMSVVRSKAPGAARLLDLDAFVDELMNAQTSVARMVKVFKNYESYVLDYVDNDMLMSMVTQPRGIMNALKSAWQGFTSGGAPWTGRQSMRLVQSLICKKPGGFYPPGFFNFLIRCFAAMLFVESFRR